MTTWVRSSSVRRAGLAGRTVCTLVVLIICTLVAGCGSSSHSGSSPSSTSSQTGTNAPSGTTTSEAEVSGKLDTLPQARPESGSLPPVPSSVTEATERTYLDNVFNDAQRFWEQEFSGSGTEYIPARLVLFTRAVHSGCGAQADSGPFYCGADRTVYLDLGFFEALARQASVGRFGQAYVVGHELGHHVQQITGIAGRVAVLNQQDPSGTNMRSVRVELQADCLAGVWAHSRLARGQKTEADLSDALTTAALVGDDFQQHASGRVPDSALWTHGSSEQRQHWLTTGFRSGSPGSCDTFASHAI